MFNKISTISNKSIKEFLVYKQKLYFIISDMVLGKFGFGKYENKMLKVIDFSFMLHTIKINNCQVSVGKLGSYERHFFSHDLNFIEKFDFRQIKEFENSSLVNETVDEKSVIASYDKTSQKNIWRLDYNSTMLYTGTQALFVVKCIEKKNNHIYAYDIQTGKEKWLYKIDTEKKFQLIRFLTEYKNAIYFYNKEDRKVYAIETETGQFINAWKFKKEPKFYENKLFSFGYFYEELNLDSMEFKEKDLLPEYKKYINYPQYRLEASYAHIGHGLGFVSAMKNYDNELGSVMDFVIYAVDLSSYKIVWSHIFEGYRGPDWDRMEYDGKRIYLLGTSGNLYIFEKEDMSHEFY